MTDQDGGYNVFDLCGGLLYWQGFWHDDAEPSLEFYLKYFCSTVAKLLIKHRYLRLCLKLFQTLNRWNIIISLSIQVFLVVPQSIYQYGSNKIDAVPLFLALIIQGLVLVIVVTVIFRQGTFLRVLEEIDNMLKLEHLDNDEQREIFCKARSLCFIIVYRIQIPYTIVYSFLTLWYHCQRLLPQRKFIVREWYPWDTISSPAFEITLFGRWVQYIVVSVTIQTLMSALIIWLIMTRTYFNILNNKFVNIIPFAMGRIKSRKLSESRRLAQDTVVNIESPGTALQGSQARARDATLNNPRRLDKLALLRPLYATGVIDSGIGTALQGAQARSRSSHTRINTRRKGSEFGQYSGTDTVLLEGQARSGRCDTRIITRRMCEAIDQYSGIDTALQGQARIRGAATINSTRRLETLPRLRLLYAGAVRNEDVKAINDVVKITSKELDTEMKVVLAEDVVLHSRIIRNVGVFESLTNEFLIAMFVTNSIFLGVASYSISTTKNVGINEWLLVIGLGMMSTLSYFIVNNWMQAISDQHNAVCESLYNSDWTGASPSFKKSMLVIMSRANVPLEVKPTGLDPLSRKNFAKVMNAAYKMINTLNSVL